MYFTNRNAAKRAIRTNIAKSKRVFYDIIKGSKLKHLPVSFMLKLGRMGKFTKYEYPPGITHKAFRTKMRRRLRRMGMLTLIKNKYAVTRKATSHPYIKHIPNKQKVANSPNTIAKAFRLERKPKDVYYLILAQTVSKKRGKLFSVTALRFNTSTREVKKQIIEVDRRDVIIPYTLTEMIQIYGKDFMDTARAQGFRFNQATRK